MLRIRRTTSIAATLVALLTAAGSAPAADPPSTELSGTDLSSTDRSPLAGSPAAALGLLLRPAVVESIAAWGLSPEEVVRDVQGLGAEELARVVGEAARLVGPDWQRSARSQAMYLVLVSQVRESLLFARVVSRMSSASTDAPLAVESPVR